jgi:hypothetical protein
MALWGNKDSKTASGTVAIASNGVVTGSSTSFTTEAKVGNTIRVAGVDYEIVTITSNTVCKVESGINGGAITVVSPAASYTLSEKPASVAASESADSGFGASGNSNKVFGVDAGEAEVTGKTHAGWVRRTVGTGGRSGRVFYETLVASGSLTGDQADDSQFADLAITIGTQPSNRSITAPASTTFTVAATNNGNQPMTYLWYADNLTGYGFRAFSAENEPVFTGWDTATLTVDVPAGEAATYTGWKFKCVITTTNGLATATTAERTLTVA